MATLLYMSSIGIKFTRDHVKGFFRVPYEANHAIKDLKLSIIAELRDRGLCDLEYEYDPDFLYVHTHTTTFEDDQLVVDVIRTTYPFGAPGTLSYLLCTGQ